MAIDFCVNLSLTCSPVIAKRSAMSYVNVLPRTWTASEQILFLLNFKCGLVDVLLKGLGVVDSLQRRSLLDKWGLEAYFCKTILMKSPLKLCGTEYCLADQNHCAWYIAPSGHRPRGYTDNLLAPSGRRPRGSTEDYVNFTSPNQHKKSRHAVLSSFKPRSTCLNPIWSLDCYFQLYSI